MYTYEESVLDAADDAGFLTSKDAKRILKAHNIPAIDCLSNPCNLAADPVVMDQRRNDALASG